MSNRAFSVLGKNLKLALAPVIMDLLSLFLALTTFGFVGESKFSLQFAISVGLPTINDILEAANSISPNLDGRGLVVLLFTLILFSFAEAGFIGQLYQLATNGSSPTGEIFFSYARRFWLRFLGLQLLLTVVVFLGLYVSMLLGVIGALAYVVGFLVLRIRYIYWEFTIVTEDLDIFTAFTRSRQLYDQRSSELAVVLTYVLVANVVAGLIFNFLPFPIVFFAGIFVYNAIATGLQLALMYTKPGLAEPPLD